MDRNAPLPLVVVAFLALMGWFRGAPPSTAPLVHQVVTSTRAGGHADAAPPKARACPPEGDLAAAAPAAGADEPAGWCQLLRLYHQFFGLQSSADPTMATLTDMVEKAAHERNYELEFVVALVPDPADSQMPAAFDQALDAVQKGLANNRYLLDRSWLPWTGAAAEAKLYRRSPGLLLFRRPRSHRDSPSLLGVLVVGETPKLGIEKEAFRQALRLIVRLRGDHAEPAPIRILGPSYSGSGESLRLALQSAQDELPGSIRFRIVTGSATARGLEDLLALELPGSVEFYRTVLPDDVLRAEALGQLHDKMGWDLGHLALLTESDTAYGQGVDPSPPASPAGQPETPAPFQLGGRSVRAGVVFAANVRVAAGAIAGADQAPTRSCACAATAVEGPEPALVLHFPSHISAIRNAREAAAPTRAAARPEDIAAGPPKTELDLSLADRGPGADLVPEFSPLTAADTEEAIANLLETISREGIRYVGILATDVRDKLFLAERIRRFSPDIVLFTLDGDLLFTHRQVQANTNGMVVISTFPLFTEGGAWLHGFTPSWLSPDQRRDPVHRRQFTSEFEQGIFHAVEALLYKGPLLETEEFKRTELLGWISVASNGSLWPVLDVPICRADLEKRGESVLAYADPDGSDTERRAAGPTPPPRSNRDVALASSGPTRATPVSTSVTGTVEEGNGLSERADLELLLFAALLCVLSSWLRREALVERSPGGVERHVAGSRGLLCFGLTLVALTGSSLLALDSLSYLPIYDLPILAWIDHYPVTPLAGHALVAFLLLLVAFLYQVRCLAVSALPVAARKRPRSARSRLGWTVRWLAAAIGALAAVELALLSCFIPGEVEYFHLRARVLSSGLSPIVPLGWLMISSFVWVLLELKRRRLIAWQDVKWPVPDSWDPALSRCSVVTDSLRELIGTTVPRGKGFWIAAAAALAPPLYLIWGVQPIGESRVYARFFLILLLLSLLLGGASFYRFWQVWQKVQKVLLRLAETPLAGRFAGLQKEVGWKPMRSFGWQIPKFRTLLLSTARLEDLVRRGKPALDRPPDDYVEHLSRLVSGAFAADSDGSPAQEIRSRRKLRRMLLVAGEDLARVQGDPDVDDFLALRAVAYLRYVFAHLRNCLMGALFPGLLLLFAVSSYAFEPKGLFSMGLFGALLIAIAMTFCVFVAMNRNPVLNLIAGVESGEVTLDRAFFGNLLNYAVLPLLGLVATQVPEAGQLLNGGLKPLLRIFGIG
jgi:hypothetical protein